MFDKLVNASISVMDTLGRMGRRHPSDYCDLQTVDSEHAIAANDGSLVSVLSISGIKRLIGNQNYYDGVIAGMTSSLSSMLEGKAHHLQVWFEVDPDRTVDDLNAVQKGSADTAARLNLDLADLFAERTAVLKNWTSSERCYIILWTHPEALSKTERQQDKKDHAANLTGKVTSALAQDPLAAVAMIRNRHGSFTEAVRSELAAVEIMCDLLSAKEALRLVRGAMDIGFTGKEWQPSMPGDRAYPAQRREPAGHEQWDTLWPRLADQLAPRDVTHIDSNIVRVGDRIYAPIYVDLFPKQPQFFAQLFARVREKNLPWRISFLMEGAGLDAFGFKAAIGQILGFANSGNALIDKAVRDLRGLQEQSGTTIVQARIALCTWAPKGDEDLLRRRVSDLARCLEGWGGCQVSEVTGDPMAGVASSLPAFSRGSIGTKTAAPMDEFMAMMPWARPSSPWSEGAVLFRSPDGKIMPYQPYSKEQITWINLIFARPGSGKSVLMNLCNLALAVAPGAMRLPRVAIIDIGPSSSGLISLLRESLPPAERHLVVHRRLKMVEQDSINPFDTQLGCRFPLPSEISFLRNMLTLLVTDLNDSLPDKGMPNLATAVIDEMYKLRSDKGDSPIRYAPGMVPEVDDALRAYNIKTDTHSTWWEVTDALFSAEQYRPAALAQRNAVPLLADAVSVAQSERIRVTFGKMIVGETREPLIDAFCRMIGDSLGMYPILARPTAFDVGQARIVSLDLDEVAKSGGVSADRQTAVMYMLARQVTAKDFYLNKSLLSEMPAPEHIEMRSTVPVAAYKAYHAARINEIEEDPKRICYDEFHRTSKASQVREQVVVDMREGRKWRVDVMLASQDLDDFDDVMINLATGVFVMDGGNASTIDDISRRFGFSDPAERHALEKRVHGPRRGGGTFLAKFATTKGWYTMLLSATLGPLELWAFSTTAEDVAIRNRLYERIGPKRARKVLSYVHPDGSAKNAVEERRQNMKNLPGAQDEKMLGVIDQMIEELIDTERRMGG